MRHSWFVVPVVFAIGGCADLNKGLADLNHSLISGRTMAQQPPNTTEARVEVPNDTKISTAFNEALPQIKKIIGVHKCIKHQDGMLLLNQEAIPGLSLSVQGWGNYLYPNNRFFLKYHDTSKCVDVRAIDSVTLAASNALKFRVVYFAQDSGETVPFHFLMKRMDNGQWLIGEQPRSY